MFARLHPNFGIGIQFRGIAIDYALSDIGDQSDALYSNIFSLRFDINKQNKLTLLGEYHNMPDGDFDVEIDSIEQKVNFPSDRGFVLGARLNTKFKKMRKGSFNDFSIRYGTGIANGGDGGLSKTWLTYGAPDLETLSFKNAYSLAIVNHAVFYG